jgi:outer membrane autotransporter protein
VNHVYRVVFNHALKCVQVVSEFARGGRAPASAGARRAPRLAPLFSGIALACAAPAAMAGVNGWNEWRASIDNNWGTGGNWEFGEPTAGSVAAYIDGSRTAVVSQPGEQTDHLHVGYASRGDLSVLGGGTLTSGTIFVGTGDGGTAATADGRVLISGAGSTWTSLTTLGVGHLGRGLVDIDNGGTLSIGLDSYIGAGISGVGAINVSGAQSLFRTDRNLLLGNQGNGTVRILDGAQMTSLAGFVGNTDTGVGLAEISGTGSRWVNTDVLNIGQLGKGTVRVEDGASVEVGGALYIGNQALSASNRSRGDLLVSGTDARFVQTGSVAVIGNAGVGAIEVSDGGAVSLGATTFGLAGSGVGTAWVTGTGSRLEVASLRIGVDGWGRVDIADSATATVRGNILLGSNASGVGTLVVGPQAVLAVGGALPASITTGNGTGTLELGGGTLRANSVLRVDSNVLLAADSTVETVNNVLMQRAISGTGQLRKTGAGSLTVSADSSGWSGGTLVDAGTLAVYGSKALGTGLVALADATRLELGDAVVLDNSVQLRGEVAVSVGTGSSATLAGGLSAGSGGVLVKTDGGQLVLAGSAYSGATRVDDGRVLATGNALPTGNIAIGSTGTFQIDTTRVLQYAGQISGTGTFAQGRHWLTLSGDSSAFAGTTVVDQGRLMVDGALGGQVNLDNGAYLAGSGRVGSVHLRSGSVLDPGPNSAVGRLTITGDLVFDPSATYRVHVAADGSSDHVDVAGVATLGGAGTVAVAADGDWKVSTRYTVLSAGDGVAGTFGGVTSNFAFLDPSLAYDANNVYLTMARNDVSMPDVQLAFPDVVVNDNQKAVAGAVEALGDGNAVYDAVVRLEIPQVVPAFDSLSGEVHSANRGALLQNRFLHDGIDRHLDGRAISGGIAPGVRVWLAGSGGQLHTDATAANVGTRTQQHGLMAGAGWQVGESLQFGVAAGQQQLDTRLRERDARAETDATEYGVYADYGWQGLRLRGGVTRADYRTDSMRTAQIGTTFAESLSAREDATATTAFVRAGWTFGGPRLQLTPEIELAQVRLESDGSQEHGGHSALQIASADSRYRTGLAALKADWDISGGLQDKAVVTARVGWQYADGDRLPTTTARFVEGAQEFGIAGAPLARSSVLAQLGVAVSPSANSRVSLQVQGRDGDGQRDMGAQLDWSVGF